MCISGVLTRIRATLDSKNECTFIWSIQNSEYRS